MRKRAAVFYSLILTATLLGLVVLAVLIVDVFRDGARWLDWDFITSFPSRFPARAGIKSAIFGTIWLMGFTALFAFPIGVGTAIYLEEYAPRHWLIQILQLNIANLAGVPSIVYGILGLTLFVRAMSLDRSILAGALTIALLVLPIIIIAAREAIKAVPNSLREGSYALGATRWQTIWHLVLPQALPGILTGTILALSRGIGETAPLLMIGALTFIAFTPASPLDPFTVLPIQIFNWTGRPQDEFRGLAAAGIIVLLGILLLMNTGAVLLRNKFQRRDEG
ncbi:MAG: phosphate ABC transporter permease PstA [Dehalococcoidia bacterium]|nr:phosphate ABC transporter permease PstA [Chloroflexota bacterium]MCZ6866973.1 phosphate ABC transporter permease PstA [Chloroflexota bacterium]